MAEKQTIDENFRERSLILREQPVSRRITQPVKTILHPRRRKKHSFCLDARFMKILDLGIYRPETLYFQFRMIYEILNITFLEIKIFLDSSEESNTNEFEKKLSHIAKIISFSDNSKKSVYKKLFDESFLYQCRVENISNWINDQYIILIREWLKQFKKSGKGNFSRLRLRRSKSI